MTENYYEKIAIKNVIFFLLTIKLATFALFYCKKKPRFYLLWSMLRSVYTDNYVITGTCLLLFLGQSKLNYQGIRNSENRESGIW